MNYQRICEVCGKLELVSESDISKGERIGNNIIDGLWINPNHLECQPCD